ncbi:hypothetical protein GCM10009785_04710 [Brooklawnia cerclae]
MAQVAGDELLLQFQPRKEEEDREQAVRRPMADGQVEIEPRDGAAEVMPPNAEVGLGKGRVRADQGQCGGEEQEGAVHPVGAQEFEGACAGGSSHTGLQHRRDERGDPAAC